MKDIELPPLPDLGSQWTPYWTKVVHKQMQSYARAAVEADRAQRVPDGWANLLKASREVLSWTQAADRPPVRDKYECGRMTGVRVHALADLHEAVQAISSTPAPAQQEHVLSSPTAMQALEALDELESSARGDEPFNHFAAPLIRQYIESCLAAQHQEQPQQEPNWWRKRADEIELAVARSGSTDAMRCYTDMRTLLQAVSRQEPPQQERKPMAEESDDDKLVDRAIDDLVMQRYGIRKD